MPAALPLRLPLFKWEVHRFDNLLPCALLISWYFGSVEAMPIA